MGEVTRIRGHAAVYDRVDRTGDVMRRGLFGALRPVPLLAQHRGPPVGTIAAIGEDALGVWIEATIEDAAAARLDAELRSVTGELDEVESDWLAAAERLEG